METAQAFNWINITMRADSALMTAATGGVWQDAADIGTVGPYALFTQQSGLDTNTMNAFRLFSSLLVQIVAVGPSNNYATLVTIANRIDALFKSNQNIGLPSGGGVLSSYREQPLATGLLVNGQEWQRLGGMYRINLQGS